jgi:hypothetical protein
LLGLRRGIERHLHRSERAGLQRNRQYRIRTECCSSVITGSHSEVFRSPHQFRDEKMHVCGFELLK